MDQLPISLIEMYIYHLKRSKAFFFFPHDQVRRIKILSNKKSKCYLFQIIGLIAYLEKPFSFSFFIFISPEDNLIWKTWKVGPDQYCPEPLVSSNTSRAFNLLREPKGTVTSTFITCRLERTTWHTKNSNNFCQVVIRSQYFLALGFLLKELKHTIHAAFTTHLCLSSYSNAINRLS